MAKKHRPPERIRFKHSSGYGSSMGAYLMRLVTRGRRQTTEIREQGDGVDSRIFIKNEGVRGLRRVLLRTLDESAERAPSFPASSDAIPRGNRGMTEFIEAVPPAPDQASVLELPKANLGGLRRAITRALNRFSVR